MSLPRTDGPLLRLVAAGVTAVALLGVVILAGAVRERDALPAAAQAFLQATIQAGAVTTCLQGVSDDLYIPGEGRLNTPTALTLAMSRLHGCDTDGLTRTLDSVHLPPAAPLTDSNHRQARSAIASGVATLRRVLLDVHAARRLMTASINGAPDGSPVVLAYRSANAGSDAAYALALQALFLLGQPQSSPAI